MKLYRFSPIGNKEQLFDAINYIHVTCHGLCKQVFDKYLINAGNVTLFCHYEDEYAKLIDIRKTLTIPTDDQNLKYFTLLQPIVIPAKGDIPETIYTHIYIRKPDPYRHHVGDIDFYIEPENYAALKRSLKDGKQINSARLFPRADLDMIELYNPDVDVLAYVSTNTMAEKAHIKLPNETNL